MKVVGLSIALFKYLFLWLLIVPITFFTKKKHIIFIGRDDGRFTDNVKYLFSHALSSGCHQEKIFFLTQNVNVFETLKNHEIPTLYYPTLKSCYVLLTTKIVIVDSERWVTNGKYHFLFNSIKVQLWHAVPTKKIGLIKKRIYVERGDYTAKNYLLDLIKGNYCSYDLLITTSEKLISTNFSKSFKSAKYLNYGYPRNDVLSRVATEFDLLCTDSISIGRIELSIKNGMQVVLYAPTFRKQDCNFSAIINFQLLNRTCYENDILFVIKQHYRPDNIIQPEIREYSNIIFYDNDTDIYPVLDRFDLLITDYSSIYFDFLFLNRPVIFFPYDLTGYYTGSEAEIQSYKSRIPSTIHFNQNDLMKEVIFVLKSKLSASSDCMLIYDETFDFQDGCSSQRVWAYINRTYE